MVRATGSTGLLVGAVGIELKATLKARKLLILLTGKNAKNTGFAQPRYTRGTRRCPSIEILLRRSPPTSMTRSVAVAAFAMHATFGRSLVALSTRGKVRERFPDFTCRAQLFSHAISHTDLRHGASPSRTLSHAPVYSFKRNAATISPATGWCHSHVEHGKKLDGPADGRQ